ncbi:hypothetical protein ACFLR5_02045 [Elusimicrobiota bacterium]
MKLKSLIIQNRDSMDYRNVSEQYETTDRNKKKLILGIETGRSGMRWLRGIFCAHDNITGANDERNTIAGAFYRYIVWNKLPIDIRGIIEITKKDIIKDWSRADTTLICSPYFSHGFLNIFNELKADNVIWAINDPRFTVTSFYNKGWYIEDNIRAEKNLCNGFQPAVDSWSHFFGRVVPKGDFYDEWISLTRIGKISWFLNTVNQEIYSYIKQIPGKKVWIFRLEDADQNYHYYLELAEKFNLLPLISKRKFLSLKGKTVRQSENVVKEWSEQEEKEFDRYTVEYRNIYRELRNRD